MDACPGLPYNTYVKVFEGISWQRFRIGYMMLLMIRKCQ